MYTQRWHPRWQRELSDTTYRVGVPGPHWEPHQEQDAQVAWRRTDGSGMITARAQCEAHGDRTLEQFLDDLRLDFRYWTEQQRSMVRFAGREGLRVRSIVTLDGVSLTMDALLLKKNGCLFDFWYVATDGAFHTGLADYERFLVGFQFPLR